MVWAGLERLDIRSGGVAAIEHQRDIFAVLGQLLAAADQRLVRLANNAASFWFPGYGWESSGMW